MQLRRASTGLGVSLGKVIGRGGEGIVHAVHGAPKLVAKIYRKPPSTSKIDKLRIMVRRRSSQLLEVAAWPQDLLIDEHDVVRGFLMGRISAREDAHRLYSPKSRRSTFPDADFRFVVRAATNLARAFAWVHAAGHVIGDVNHGNALIGKDGTAMLIDCDSFQVSEQARVFPCDVGSPLFTPPELQGKSFRGLRREATHDLFGLAVLLFHLLFQGRHPFAGRYEGGDLSLEQAITEFRFAYGSRAAELGMTPPPGTMPLATFGPSIAALFERAFAPPGDSPRPAASEWIEPLQKLELSLVGCTRRPRHFHPPGPHCCWCMFERVTGTTLFESATAPDGSGGITPEELWKEIQRVPAPTPYAQMPHLGPPVDPMEAFESAQAKAGWAVLWIMGLITLSKGVGGVLAAIGLVLGIAAAVGLLLSANGTARIRHVMRADWHAAVEQWKERSSASHFFQLKAGLRKNFDELTRIDRERNLAIDKLKRHHLPLQRETFLDGFELEKATFTNVSPSDIEVLKSRGIRSAGDVLRSRQKTGSVTDAAWKELRSWAERCRGAYAFDDRDPAYAALAEPVESRAREQRQEIVHALMLGRAELVRRRAEIDKARREADARLKAKYLELGA